MLDTESTVLDGSVQPALLVEQMLICMRSMFETARYNLALTETDPAKSGK